VYEYGVCSLVGCVPVCASSDTARAAADCSAEWRDELVQGRRHARAVPWRGAAAGVDPRGFAAPHAVRTVRSSFFLIHKKSLPTPAIHRRVSRPHKGWRVVGMPTVIFQIKGEIFGACEGAAIASNLT